MLVPVLVIAAVGIFINPATGQQEQAVARMPSLTACANVINQNREPRTIDEGPYAGTWYLTKAECVVLKGNENVTYDRHGNRKP